MKTPWKASLLAMTGALVLALSGCALLGLGTPTISLFQGSTKIMSGGSFDFGSTATGSSSIPVDFTIKNGGDGELDLSDSSALSIEGSDASDFSLDTSPPASITAGSTGDFAIIFSPSMMGAETADITVTGAKGSAFTFTVTGTGFTS